MPKFNIPIVLQIKADTQEEAESKVDRLMDCAGEYSLSNEAPLFDSWKQWGFAEIQIRVRKNE